MTYYTSNVVGAVPKFRIIGGTMSISNRTLIHVCTCVHVHIFFPFHTLSFNWSGGKSEMGEDFVSSMKHFNKV